MPTLDEMFDVRGKSVIVTGGASGIGRAYAEVMADNGAPVGAGRTRRRRARARATSSRTPTGLVK